MNMKVKMKMRMRMMITNPKKNVNVQQQNQQPQLPPPSQNKQLPSIEIANKTVLTTLNYLMNWLQKLPTTYLDPVLHLTATHVR